jgi:DNA-binding transcriptional MerR regulator
MDDAKTYTIKQVASLSGLPASTLRYYENIGLIPAVARDSSSKQRAYTQHDVDRIDALACLSATGLSIDDMRAYLGNISLGRAGARSEIELLRAQAARLEAESQHVELRKKYVALKVRYWQLIEVGDEVGAKQISSEARQLSQALKQSSDR